MYMILSSNGNSNTYMIFDGLIGTIRDHPVGKKTGAVAMTG